MLQLASRRLVALLSFLLVSLYGLIACWTDLRPGEPEERFELHKLFGTLAAKPAATVRTLILAFRLVWLVGVFDMCRSAPLLFVQMHCSLFLLSNFWSIHITQVAEQHLPFPPLIARSPLALASLNRSPINDLLRDRCERLAPGRKFLIRHAL